MPLAAEAIERPEQHQLELAPAGILKQFPELLSLVRALASALVVDVLAGDLVTGIRAPGAQLPDLIFRVLTFVVS